MKEEMHSLLKNDTWDLVPLPDGSKIVHCRWVYRAKFSTDGNVDKFKTALLPKVSLMVEVLITQKLLSLLQRWIQSDLLFHLLLLNVEKYIK